MKRKFALNIREHRLEGDRPSELQMKVLDVENYITREFAEKEIDNNELFELNINPKVPARHIGIATLKDMIPSFAAREFINIILTI